MNYMRLDGTFGRRSITHLDWIPMRERIKELMKDPPSACQIAGIIGREFECRVTRNMIIGQIRRHNLGQLAMRNKWGDIVIPGAPKKKRVWPKRIRVRKAAPTPAVPQGPATNEETDQSTSLSQRLTLLQLNASTCHWPVGDPTTTDFFFCGAESYQGKPYCAAHCRRAFNYEATNKRFQRVLAKRAA